MFLYEELKTS